MTMEPNTHSGADEWRHERSEGGWEIRDHLNALVAVLPNATEQTAREIVRAHNAIGYARFEEEGEVAWIAESAASRNYSLAEAVERLEGHRAFLRRVGAL